MILISGFLIFDNWRNEGKLVIGGLPNARHERLGAGGFDLGTCPTHCKVNFKNLQCSKGGGEILLFCPMIV